MIIGVSGKIGAGKDLVGLIILGLKAGLTTEEILKLTEEDIWWLEEQSNFEVKKFADKLKDIVCLLIGCTREQLEDREFKEKELGEEWWYWHMKFDGGYGNIMLDYLSTSKEELDNYEGITLVKLTPRLLLQLLGTQIGRNIIHPNIWVNALMADYREEGWEYSVEMLGLGYSGEQQLKVKSKPEKVITYPNWIITDVRFPNEAKVIKDRGGILIRIDRDYVLRGGLEDPKLQHESETALDNYQNFDYIIQNDGTIEELIEKIKKIVDGTNTN